MRLILASSSPRRAQILREAGIVFEAAAAPVDETPQAGEPPQELVQRLAHWKAEAVVKCMMQTPQMNGPAVILAADTEVVLDGRVLGKPASEAEALAMLRDLAGRVHDVITGVELIRLPDRAVRRAVELTRVTFDAMSDDEMRAYVASGEPMDKAGGYAIQGRAGRFIPRIEGCYFNVMGLPLARVHTMLRELGFSSSLAAGARTGESF